MHVGRVGENWAMPVTAAERARLMENPGFGRVFTDHMISADWDEERGWSELEAGPHEPLQLAPSALGLQYAQSVFDGLKAFAQPDGSVGVFRPQMNARRFQDSARRIALPEVPTDMFLEAIRRIVELDRDWVPAADGQAFYLRPLLYGTEATMEVHPSRSARFLLFASPVGSYFAGGIKPVTVWLSQEYSRAAPGGTGAAKYGGNYGGSLLAQREAVANGCDQVVWLDSSTHTVVEEMGGMNLFFVFGDRLLTPALTGTLLPGVTRDSLLVLANDRGFAAEEGRITVDEWRQGCEAGALTEVFACGTAAVITPVGHVRSAAGDWAIADGSAGEVTMDLRQALVDVQYGRAPDPHGWLWKL